MIYKYKESILIGFGEVKVQQQVIKTIDNRGK